MPKNAISVRKGMVWWILMLIPLLKFVLNLLIFFQNTVILTKPMYWIFSKVNVSLVKVVIIH